MERLTLQQVLNNIAHEICFHAVLEDYSCTIKIEKYTHYVCAAVHNGHQFRKELWENCLHTEYERWYEEDPCTKQLIENQPIVLAGCDSRFEYDLNRTPEDAIYEDAWGKKLWKQKLPEAQKQKSLQKHTNFYTIVHALLTKLNEKHKATIVYDMHSYNWKRWDREVPTWNLGTANVDANRFKNSILLWQKTLSEIKFPNTIKATSKINDTFKGNGYFLKYITQNFTNTLVLATELAKVYCDEYNYIIFPEVVAAVEQALNKHLPEHAAHFNTTYSN